MEARLADASAEADRDGILRDAGQRLGIAVAPIVGALDLSEIVLSGPPELLDGPLLQQTADTLRARTLAEFHDGVRVRMTQHGQSIVLRGTRRHGALSGRRLVIPPPLRSIQARPDHTPLNTREGTP